MFTNVLYAPEHGELREDGTRLLNEHGITFHLVTWPADYPGPIECLCLVSAIGDFVGLDQIRFYANKYELLHTIANEQVFDTLANQWLSETQHHATIQYGTLHPAYQKILKMGKTAVPFIFKRLQQQPEHWFPLLAQVTNENPVTEEMRGNVPAITQAWIEWGRREGYIK